MKPVTIYVADDGSRWDTEDGAIAHERLIAAVDAAMGPLGPPPADEDCSFSNGRGYLQHDPEAVVRARSALIKLVAEAHPEVARYIGGVDPRTTDFGGSVVGRILDDSGSWLYPAWCRLARIDEYGREWGQCYFRYHPDLAVCFEIAR